MDELEVMPGVRITSHQCIWIPDDATVVMADLHIGYESALEADGIYIPRIQTDTIQESLAKIIDHFSPDRLIIAGDLKHEFSRNLTQELRDIRKVLEQLVKQVDVVLVKGNHDNYVENIVSRLDVPVVERYVQNNITIVHGHAPCSNRPLIMGHEHPSIKIVDKVGAYLKLPCFMHLKDEGVIVLPAFSPLASGTDLTGAPPSDYLSPILRDMNVLRADIYASSDIGLIPLGNLSLLERLRF